MPPRVLIVAGPNGSGKSTLAEAYVQGIPYINGDEIKRTYKNEIGKSLDQFSLRTLIKTKIDDYIRSGDSFAMESNLVSNYSYEIVHDLSSKRYQTNTLNVRILQRAMLGKHYVSPTDVDQRYKEALQKLPSNLKLFNKVSILDNSLNDSSPIELMHLENGIITFKKELLPNWLQERFPIIEKLSNAYKKLRGGKSIE